MSPDLTRVLVSLVRVLDAALGLGEVDCSLDREEAEEGLVVDRGELGRSPTLRGDSGALLLVAAASLRGEIGGGRGSVISPKWPIEGADCANEMAA